MLEETLRKYPPAWVGPRRSIEPFEFEGHTVPGRAFVNYSSWASHHLPDVFSDPEEFRPDRFTPEARAALPKGAYVPFGGGSRTCIGMRFGQLEVRTIATVILSRFTLSLTDGFRLTIRQMPTISPKQGLPMVVSRRAPLPAATSRRWPESAGLAAPGCERARRRRRPQRRLAAHRQPIAQRPARLPRSPPLPARRRAGRRTASAEARTSSNPSGRTTSLPSLARGHAR